MLRDSIMDTFTRRYLVFRNARSDITSLFSHQRALLADNWYSLSYLYFSLVGTVVAISVGLTVSLLTGRKHSVTVINMQSHEIQ